VLRLLLSVASGNIASLRHVQTQGSLGSRVLVVLRSWPSCWYFSWISSCCVSQGKRLQEQRDRVVTALRCFQVPDGVSGNNGQQIPLHAASM
jgi:hypothetical protein